MWQLFNALFIDHLEFGLFTEVPRDQERDENKATHMECRYTIIRTRY